MDEMPSSLRRCISLLLLFALINFTFPVPKIQADDGLDDYNHAVGLYKQRRWSLAADTFQEFLKDHKKHVKVPYARLYLGLTLINLEKYKDARKVLRSYVKDYQKSKNLTDALYRVAECSYMLDDVKAAETEFLEFLKKAKKDEPLFEWALPYLADCHLKLNKPKEAAKRFQQSLDRFPKGRLAEDSKFSLAICHEALNQFDEALTLYKELAANAAGTRAAQAQMNLAARYFDTKQFDLAAAAYEDVEKRFSKSGLLPQARLNAGFANYQQGSFRSAAKQFELAAITQSQAVTAQFWQGLSHKSLGEYPQAITLMKAAFNAAGDNPQAEEILYHWADSELRQRAYATSRERYLELVSRWPRGDLADDSLHFAAETALLQSLDLAGDERKRVMQVASDLLDRFAKQYPDSGLALHQKLLRGRVLVADGASEKLEDAAKLFQNVMESSSIERTQLDARYQLARTKQLMARHLEVIDVVTPLLEHVEDQGKESAYIDALVLAAISLAAEDKHAATRQVTASYLKLQPKGTQADQALSLQATAEANLGHKPAAQQSLEKLQRQFPQSPTLARTVHRLAEIAYDGNDWDWSLELFADVVKLGDDSPYHVLGLSGVAWCQFQKKQFSQAADSFRLVIKEHPKHELASEAAFKIGQSLQEAGKQVDAIAAYKSAFQTYAPSENAYKAGLQAARLLADAKKVDEADSAYDDLLKKFPKPKELDKRLDEWALLNYESERYERADEIFARLVKDVPESDLADNARYHLAESDLIAGKLDAAKQVFRNLESDAKSDEDVQQDSLSKLLAIATEQSEWNEVVKVSKQIDERFKGGRYALDAEFYRGEAQLHLGKLDDARDTLLSLKNRKDEADVNKQDWFTHVWTLLAEVYVQRKEYDAVVDISNEYRKWDSKSPYLYRMDEVLGRCFKNQSKFDEARAAFTSAIKSTNGRRTETAAKCQLFLSETYFFQKQYERALSEYLKVYNLYDFPEWRSAGLFQAAVCDEQLKQWGDAVRAYELLLEKFPNSQFASKAKAKLPAARRRADAG